MKASCRRADADDRVGESLTDYLAQFCATSAALYAKPDPPNDELNLARAGDFLLCKGHQCSDKMAPAAQGVLSGNVNDGGDLAESVTFKVHVGGAETESDPSSVPTDWVDQSKTA